MTNKVSKKKVLLSKKEQLIAEKYEGMTKNDWSDFDKKAKKESRVVNRPLSLEDASKTLSKLRESKSPRKMYSFRLKTNVINAIKAKAAAGGVPYQSYVNAILEEAAKI